MHRLAAVPGSTSPSDGVVFIEQPPAEVVLLSSADTDLAALASLLDHDPHPLGEAVAIRALNLAALQHPAVCDHYLRTSLQQTRLLVVRLLGGRSHWGYGLEQLQRWAAQAPGRQLMVLAGTPDLETELLPLGTVDPAISRACGRCLQEGGGDNLQRVLHSLRGLLEQGSAEPPCPQPLADPLPHDWREEPGPRVGVVLYRALLQAGDLALVEALLQALRSKGLAPRALWVSSLRSDAVQGGVADLLRREAVELVLCTTSFASVQWSEAGLGAPLWEGLAVPVLQLLCSSQSREAWEASSLGLSPLDLSLQVALPELDGRITTRVGAFKQPISADPRLATALQRYVPDADRLGWVAELAARWCALRCTPAQQRRLALVLANYPTRNSRLANGVGLDTPASAAAMLRWLREAGYTLGPHPLPDRKSTRLNSSHSSVSRMPSSA